MKPYVVIGYIRNHLQEVLYQDIRGQTRHAFSATVPTSLGVVAQDGQTPNPVYFADNEEEAHRVAMGLSLKFNNFNWLVAKTTALVDMPPRPNGWAPEVKSFSEKGLLP